MFIRFISIVLAALVLNITGCTEQKSSQPNVIVIISDDAGYIDFQCYGGREIPTPNIDRLAASGVRCTNGYVTASVCAPSRAGLMTGRYQQRFGHEFNGPNSPVPGYSMADMGLDPAELTMGNRMQEAGYHTIALGKWHLGEQPGHHPLQRGFDEFYGFLAGARSYFPSDDPAERHMLRQGNTVLSEPDNVHYLTDDLTDRAVEFIDKNQDRPFFMYLAYNAVHNPMEGKPEIIDRFGNITDTKRRTYAAMMASLDEGVGRVMETLDREQLTDNTLIFFVNDNGGATGNASDNGPLRGMKGSKWEGGIRVATLLSWPGTLPANTEYHQPVSSLDFLPTALAAAGKPLPADNQLDGVNLLPYLSGDNTNAPHDILFWRRGVAAAVRRGPWKIIRSEGNPTLLFNLERDQSEQNNLAEQHPEIMQELLAALVNWERDLAEPKWREGKKWDHNQVMKHRMDVIGRDMERKYP
jgi:arylsulfatase A-like enzyme